MSRMKYRPGWAGRTRELVVTDEESEDVRERVVHLVNESAPVGKKGLSTEDNIRRALAALMLTYVHVAKAHGIPLPKIVQSVEESYAVLPETGL